jgi:superfamily I DNA/RNA helicase
VLTTEGPVLVLAGAGTGKTAALTARLAHLIATRRAWPSEILAVTFTNKAAREMRERVGRIVGPAVEGMPWLGTFHSVAAKMLRRHAELVGLQSNFTILDTDDQLRLLKQLIPPPTSTRSAGPAASSPASSTAGRTAAGRPSSRRRRERSLRQRQGAELYAHTRSG